MTHRTMSVVAAIGLAAGLFAAGAVLAGEPQSGQPKIDDVISHVIDAYGGEKALRGVAGFHARGNQWALQSDQPIETERWFARPDRLRLELNYPDHHETRVTDGDHGWTGDSMTTLRPADEMKLIAMRMQTARLDIPLRLLEHKDKIESRGTDPDDRIVLRVPVDAELYIDYHIDPKTYHITRMVAGKPGWPMEFSADYDQFQMVGGVLVPYRETTYAGHTKTSTYQTTGFTWNPKDLDANLRVPDAGD